MESNTSNSIWSSSRNSDILPPAAENKMGPPLNDPADKAVTGHTVLNFLIISHCSSSKFYNRVRRGEWMNEWLAKTIYSFPLFRLFPTAYRNIHRDFDRWVLFESYSVDNLSGRNDHTLNSIGEHSCSCSILASQGWGVGRQKNAEEDDQSMQQ